MTLETEQLLKTLVNNKKYTITQDSQNNTELQAKGNKSNMKIRNTTPSFNDITT